jgi:hypothetical protein
MKTVAMPAPRGCTPPRSLSILAIVMSMTVTLIGVVTGDAHAKGPEQVATVSEPTCRTTANGPIRPARALIAELNRTVGVVGVGRKRNGEIGSPPLTQRGKRLLGWDRHKRPGAGWGSVVLDAHTWPDGSALGNAMLRRLHTGSTITVQDVAGRSVCYRITERSSYRRTKLPRRKMFRTWGPEQVVIVVCSGKRLGPGNWLRRTVWYAVPVATPDPVEAS